MDPSNDQGESFCFPDTFLLPAWPYPTPTLGVVLVSPESPNKSRGACPALQVPPRSHLTPLSHPTHLQPPLEGAEGSPQVYTARVAAPPTLLPQLRCSPVPLSSRDPHASHRHPVCTTHPGVCVSSALLCLWIPHCLRWGVCMENRASDAGVGLWLLTVLQPQHQSECWACSVFGLDE